MPLRGDLREFGIPEVFQLLEQQAKTGCLYLKTDLRDIEVYFREGMVVGAIPAGVDPWDYLMEILRRAGYLSDEDVKRLEKRPANDLASLKEILRGEALLGPREVDVLLKEHIEELLFPVFEKKKGEFFFVQGKMLPSDWELREPVPPEPLVLEGLRKTDEWPLLKKRIGSFQEVPERRVALREARQPAWKQRIRNLWNRRSVKTVVMTPGGTEEDLTLECEPLPSYAERCIYNLIDGRRTIEEIIQASSMGRYTACQAFLALQDRGWIRFPGARREVPIRKTSGLDPAGVRKANWLTGAVTFVGLVVLILFIHGVTQGFGVASLGRAPFGRLGATVCRLLNLSERDRVLRALELYRKEEGRYPETLEDLVRGRLLRNEDLRLWGPNRFSYVLEPESGVKLLIAPNSRGRRDRNEQ